jgi:hypothetical protein
MRASKWPLRATRESAHTDTDRSPTWTRTVVVSLAGDDSAGFAALAA